MKKQSIANVDNNNNGNISSLPNIARISAPPGKNFTEWKAITARLLKKRECQLMETRCGVTKSTINQAIQRFAANNALCIDSMWDFDANYQENTLHELCELINTWNGVRVSRLKSTKMKCFKSYFVIGKNWCDQNKKKVWAPHFWVKILTQIQKFAKDTASDEWNTQCILKQKEFAHCLELEIVSAIFNKTVQFAQTKKQPLIPNGTLKQCQGIKQYLLDLDASLAVDEWCTLQTTQQKADDAKMNAQRKRTGNAKLLVQQLKNTLCDLLLISQNKLLHNSYHINWCIDRLRCTHDADCTSIDHSDNKAPASIPPSVDASYHIPMKPPPPQPKPQPMPPSPRQYHNFAYRYPEPPPLPPQSYVYPSYQPSHGASQRVSEQRYAPFQPVPPSLNSAYSCHCSQCCPCCYETPPRRSIPYARNINNSHHSNICNYDPEMYSNSHS